VDLPSARAGGQWGSECQEPRDPAGPEHARPGGDVRDGVDDLPQVVEQAVAAVRPRLRGSLHVAGLAVSLVTGPLLLAVAAPGLPRAVAAVYAASVTLMFGTSALYHRRYLAWSPRARGVMTRLDHSMIFVLIAGTYTPFAALALSGTAATAVLVVVWAGALAGIAFRVAAPGAPRWSTVPLYIGLGWVAAFVFPQLHAGAGPVVLWLLGLGGVLYSVGGVVYALARPDPWPRWFGHHEIFHALTLLAFAAHYAAVALVVAA
jgi:hemolysin III